MQKFQWIVVLVFVLTGCDTLNQGQVLVRVSSLNELSKGPETKAISVLSSFADSKGLLDKTNESKVDGTLVYFEGRDKYFPILLGARWVSDGIVIDILHFHPGGGETETYTAIKEELLSLLKLEFGDRVTTVPYDKQYEILLKNP